jgi:transaldolase/glucose-6-phosphate isomerase
MGGSSLSAEACRSIFGTIPNYPQLIVLDSTDPNTIKTVENQIDLNSTLFIVSSKSGATLETMSFFKYFYKKMKQELGAKVGKCFIAITDGGTPLAEKARQREFRRIFINPNDIGGRYSVLSYFGLVPIALMGIDIRQVINNAQLFLSSVDPVIPSALNPAVKLGVLLGTAHQHGKDLVTFFISDSIRAFGSWVEQLLAESTGKQGKGLIPIVNEPFVAVESYDHNRIFVYLHAGEMKNSNIEKQLLALKQAGHPIIQIDIKDKTNIGAEFYRWEIATAIAAMIMRINPFNEPNVAESKQNTAELLEEFETDGFFENGELKFERGNVAFFCKSDEKWCIMRSNDSINDFLSRFLEFEDHKNYITLLPFFQQTIERDKLLNQLRQKIQNRVKMATSIGYGPRYMHSTGQLHKGGSNNGVYIIMTIDPENEIAIPGEPYGFATLQIAQALGDLRSLENKGRQVIRIHLKGNVDQALTNLVEKIDF